MGLTQSGDGEGLRVLSPAGLDEDESYHELYSFKALNSGNNLNELRKGPCELNEMQPQPAP